MRSRLLRPLLVIEFLIAVEVWLTFWSEVGGQYHLDLMFWPWKFGLTVAAATLICAITADLFQAGGAISRRVVVYAALLFAVMVVAGVVTYYYHMNEPTDDDNGDDTQPTVTELLPCGAGNFACSRLSGGFLAYRTATGRSGTQPL